MLYLLTLNQGSRFRL